MHGWFPARLGLTRLSTFLLKSVSFGPAWLEKLSQTWLEISKDGWPADRPRGQSEKSLNLGAGRFSEKTPQPQGETKQNQKDFLFVFSPQPDNSSVGE